MSDPQAKEGQNPVGFAPVPFALLWPILRLVAVPLILAVLPALLRRIADWIESGRTGEISEQTITGLIEENQAVAKAAYKGD